MRKTRSPRNTLRGHSGMVITSARQPILTTCVLHVVALRSQEHVSRVYAAGVVTAGAIVADEKAIRDWTYQGFVGESTSAHCAASDRDVAVFVSLAAINPAVTDNLDALPQSRHRVRQRGALYGDTVALGRAELSLPFEDARARHGKGRATCRTGSVLSGRLTLHRDLPLARNRGASPDRVLDGAGLSRVNFTSCSPSPSRERVN